MKFIQTYFMSMALALLVALVLSMPGKASASSIGPGFDLFTTPDGTVSLDFTVAGLGLGLVDFESDPIPGEPGDADTIIERLEGPGLGDGEIGIINIELVALSLRSVAPVDIDFGFGDGVESFNLFLSLDESQQSLGEMDILTHNESLGDFGGGTFDSFLNVFIKIEFVRAIDSLLFFTQLIADQLTPSLDGPNTWSHTENGGFYPTGITRHEGPHPETVSIIPLPAALPLYGTGLAAMGVLGWYRKRKAAA